METDDSPTHWHALPGQDALTRLEVTPEGLSPGEAARRLETHGPNRLPQRTRHGVLRLLARQVENPLIWVLLGAAALAIALGKTLDGVVVLAVVVLNGVIGFAQEFRAGKAIEALARMVPQNATVLRGGLPQSVHVEALVPGDVVRLEAGDRVPADVRLLAVKGLRVEEAALTGESVPVDKGTAPAAEDAVPGDRLSMAFSGTLVRQGTGTGVVVATGGATELGRISHLLETTTEVETPLTRELGAVGRVITLGVLALAVVMVLIGAWRSVEHGAALGEALADTLTFAVAMAVGAIPEGLPAAVTIALAIGVQRMASRRAVVRHLPAVETLGGTTVICTDKTGTLTRNEMTAASLRTAGGSYAVEGVGYAPEGGFRRDGEAIAPPDDVVDLLRAGALCGDAALTHVDGDWRVVGDPTEGALVAAAEKAGVDVEQERVRRPRLDVVPFESETRRMLTLHGAGDHAELFLKGATERVLPLCAGVDADAVEAEMEAMAATGVRVLAVARKRLPAGTSTIEPHDLEGDFELLGLVGLIDPPRPEAIAAVARCGAAGIAVKMITGDHPGTARAIGEQLGLGGGRTVTGAELGRASPEELRALARRSNVFARVAPEHKLALVRALQAEGATVAMTGDGVNDAPALQQSDIGVAMGITGTSVAKETADIVLTDDNFASIAAAVEEGRRVYDNLVKVLAFVLPTNLALAAILVAAVAFFPYDAATGGLLLAMSPVQLLWINLVSSVLLTLPLAAEPVEPDAMARPPRPRDAPILDRALVWRTAGIGLVIAGAAVGLFLWEYRRELADGVAPDLARAEAQTMAVTTVIAIQIAYMLHCRSLTSLVPKLAPQGNRPLVLGTLALVALQAAFIYFAPLRAVFGTAPLGVRDLAFALAAAVATVPLMALVKWASGGKRRGPRRAAPRVTPEGLPTG
jgi:Ca2+-transporting ATPase